MRYLAIDYGAKRIGLALCDANETIVSPLKVLNDPKNFIRDISAVIESENIEALVLGVPLNMDGSEGGQAKTTLQFAEKLKKQISVPLLFQDERLSTFAAEEKLAPAEYSHRKKKERLDAVAAADILETFLENKKQDKSRQG